MAVVDVGGRVMPDDPYEGRHLVIFGVDPGVETGWSCLRAPVGLVATQGVRRTLTRCGWWHGTVRRSKTEERSRYKDSYHVDRILEKARETYEEHVDEEEGDEFLFVWESFTLRMLSMDENLLAPVRVTTVFLDRVREATVNLIFFSPSDAKTVVTNGRLRNWGMYIPGEPAHVRDADRQSIMGLRKFASEPLFRKKLGFEEI